MKINKKVLTAIYVSAWVSGLGLLGVAALLSIGTAHLLTVIGIVAVFSVILLLLKSIEDYQRAQREELRREIKEAVRRGILDAKREDPINDMYTLGKQ
jgi:predicted RecB family endonuclease